MKMKQDLADKILKSISTNKLNPQRYLGNGGYWYNYFLVATELAWGKNLCDGYNLDFYDTDRSNVQQTHLASFTLDFIKGYNPKSGFYEKPRLR
jgi:hypothetical protein